MTDYNGQLNSGYQVPLPNWQNPVDYQGLMPGGFFQPVPLQFPPAGPILMNYMKRHKRETAAIKTRLEKVIGENDKGILESKDILRFEKIKEEKNKKEKDNINSKNKKSKKDRTQSKENSPKKVRFSKIVLV